ncbi:hypothetical protein [Frigoriglobus tundricola]|uniref:Uncharacterized protein n=1 Tax=Frigoriglobus tundricola TaxID=2774151 RepID=A0A6M5YM05_9BACT|nr:hypothetical protein [Frigoriglobus tundricola]QJW94281.1 hypothetical protein FTUN_1801 [Frigoriglobus tundricola]
MGKLAAFLEKEANRIRAERATKEPETAREWCEAVNQMMELMEGWIRESDPSGLLPIHCYTFGQIERKIGYYETRALRIATGYRECTITPRARWVLGAAAIPGETLADIEGTIEMQHGPFTHYSIHRIMRNGSYQWLMQNEYKIEKRRPWDSYPFTREAFEEAMINILE